MPIENALRQRAQALLEQGLLPPKVGGATWGGEGSGDRCALCAQVIGLHDMEYEVSSGLATYRFHVHCHSIWQTECARFGKHVPEPEL